VTPKAGIYEGNGCYIRAHSTDAGQILHLIKADPEAALHKLASLASFGEKMRQIYPRCETEFHIGDTAEQVHLVAFSLKANLIITASYHPGFLGHLLELEQARRITTHAPCPVLVLHEPEE
jgi:nucleotide-binding universal stress UspA family protein